MLRVSWKHRTALSPIGSKEGLLLPLTQSFLQRVEFTRGIAARWKITLGTEAPIAIDPEGRLGKPSVTGISTSVLWEHENVRLWQRK